MRKRVAGGLVVLALFALAPARAGAGGSQTEIGAGARPGREAVIVWSGPRLPEGAPKRVALSFDDGPAPGVTDRILATLSAYGVNATFFCLGSRLANPAGRRLLAQTVAEGHEIGNHGYSHRNFTRLPPEELRREIESTADLMEEITGMRPTLLRPPGGGLSIPVMRTLASSTVRTVVLWDVDPTDWRAPGSRILWERVVASVRPGSIILLHDSHRETAEALPILLDLLEGEGYRVGSVGMLLAADEEAREEETR